jgi:hypothetical protein
MHLFIYTFLSLALIYDSLSCGFNRSKKSKKKDHGEGLLSMRARPPLEREFIDILQKFKLSFNLLVSLSFPHSLSLSLSL